METILEIRNISKSFGPIKVLDDVSMKVYKGEVLALSGENGAGKSTLMKIISGVYTPDIDKGILLFKGKPYEQFSLSYVRSIGISLIYQELSIAPNITVMENIFMGNETQSWGFLDKKSMITKADEILRTLKADFSATDKAGILSIAQRQQIEIARAISHNSNLIIMDEPTASLSDKEVKNLFELIQSLQSQGITIIFISHKMDEIEKIADRVAVLRDGKYIGESQVQDIEKIIYMMVGRTISSFYDEQDSSTQENNGKLQTRLKLENIHDESGFVKNISCELSSGQVIGISGLIGSGRSELARLLFGADTLKQGSVYLNEEKLSIKSPIDAIKYGIGMVPEDRKLQGLFLDMNSLENIVENKQRDNAYINIFINNKINDAIAERSIEELNIKTTKSTKVDELSGGNQQKILLARWLNIAPKVLILDEPTRGIDIGAKHEIYKIIKKLARQGTLIIIISSELPEIIHLSDRVLVMREGSLVGDITDKNAITQEYIMTLCTHKESGETI